VTDRPISGPPDDDGGSPSGSVGSPSEETASPSRETGSRSEEEEARTPRAEYIRLQRARGPGLLSRLPGMAYQCRNDPDWTMEFVSVGARELTGYDPWELVDEQGTTWSDLIHEEDREGVWRDVQAAVSEDRPFDLEYRIRTRSGEERWVWEQGHPVRSDAGELLGLEGFITDVTERHRVTAELHRSMEMLRTVVEQDLFGVYVIQGGLFRYVNGTFGRIFGYERSEIVDRMAPGDLVVEADRDTVNENIRRREEGKIDTLHYAFRGRRHDGTELPVEVHGTRAFLHGAPAVAGVLLDASDREELERQLRGAQKREALAELTGAVAHDFNNFLTGIIGLVDLASAELADLMPGEPERKVRPARAVLRTVADHLLMTRSTAEHAASLTRQLLTFSRKRIDQPRTFDLNRVVEELEPLLRQMMGSPVTLEVETAPGPLWVHLDSGCAEQVVMNLVLNARDAMPEGGTVTVRTGSAEGADLDGVERPPHAPAAVREGPAALRESRVLLEVADDGRGMDLESLERVFEPFFTTKESGTGLGLSTVRRIVEDAGGRVKVDSAPGEGATFRILLPAYAPPVGGKGEEASAEAGSASKGPGRDGEPDRDALVLVVEDDDAIRPVIRTALRKQGYRVESVSTVASALELMDQPAEPPALLLTDVSLPDRTGVELAEAYLERYPEGVVIFASGYAPEEWPGDGSVAERSDFLEKPFSVDELVGAVRRALRAGT